MKALVPGLAVISGLAMLTGCMSAAPHADVLSESATRLQVAYSYNAALVAETLESRGCAPALEGRYTCPLPADGQEYTVGVVLWAPQGLRADGQDLGADRPERDENQDRVYRERMMPPGESKPIGSGPVQDTSLPRTSTTRATRPRLWMQARVTRSGSDQAVRLGGPQAAALRQSLDALLVEGLPVIQAEYDEARVGE